MAQRATSLGPKSFSFFLVLFCLCSFEHFLCFRYFFETPSSIFRCFGTCEVQKSEHIEHFPCSMHFLVWAYVLRDFEPPLQSPI